MLFYILYILIVLGNFKYGYTSLEKNHKSEKRIQNILQQYAEPIILKTPAKDSLTIQLPADKASIFIYEFSSFDCHFCKDYILNIFPDINRLIKINNIYYTIINEISSEEALNYILGNYIVFHQGKLPLLIFDEFYKIQENDRKKILDQILTDNYNNQETIYHNIRSMFEEIHEMITDEYDITTLPIESKLFISRIKEIYHSNSSSNNLKKFHQYRNSVVNNNIPISHDNIQQLLQYLNISKETFQNFKNIYKNKIIKDHLILKKQINFSPGMIIAYNGKQYLTSGKNVLKILKEGFLFD